MNKLLAVNVRVFSISRSSARWWWYCATTSCESFSDECWRLMKWLFPKCRRSRKLCTGRRPSWTRLLHAVESSRGSCPSTGCCQTASARTTRSDVECTSLAGSTLSKPGYSLTIDVAKLRSPSLRSIGLLKVFSNIFAPSNSAGTRTVCVKNLRKNSRGCRGSCKLIEGRYETLAFSTNITLYFENGIRDGHSCNGRRIGTCVRSIEWCHFQWSRVTPNPDFKVKVFFNLKYFKNGGTQL